MRSDRPLIISILLLAAGLGLIFGYCTGTAGFNAAYPFAGANLQLAITTTGPAAIGGLVLTVLGLLMMIWALICAFIGQIQLIGTGSRDRRERRVVERELVVEHPKEYPAREYIPKA
jgi:hypothetical protein